MNQDGKLELRPPRQQNYQFAYHLAPELLFRSDIAAMIPMAHPQGFDFWKGHWSKMAVVYPREHVVQEDGIASEAYYIGEGAYALLVTMPQAEFSFEASNLIVVFRPAIEYFVLGNGIDATDWFTLRKVDTHANARCCLIEKATAEGILKAVCDELGIEPDIRRAEDDEFRGIAKTIPPFPIPLEPPRFNNVWTLGVMYRVLSLILGDTSKVAPADAAEVFSKLPPQAHQLAAAWMHIIASKPELTRADLDSLPGLKSNGRTTYGIWIALGTILMVLCLVGEIGRRLVPAPNPNPAVIAGPTYVFAILAAASWIYSFMSFRRTRST